MIRQYRYIQGKYSIEFPGGGIDAGENIETAAYRELIEETGYKGKNLRKIGSFAPCVGLIDETCHVFLIDAISETKPKEDEWESMETIILNTKQIEENIATGNIWSGMALSAWMLAQREL